MKALKPAHREKRRYLLVSGKDAGKKEIDDAILKFVGVLGYAKAGPLIVKQMPGKVVLSINRSELEKVRASFVLSGKNLRIEKVSGMINKL